MNRTKLKNYAPQARRDFIQAITDRAAHYGLTANNIADVTAEQGDVAIIGGKPFHRSILAKRQQLIDRIKRNGFAQTMEAIAYTWFNRFVAIRFMELHGYLDHGYRVLSTTDDTERTDGNRTSVPSVKSVVKPPEILLHAEHVALPGLNRDKVIELKLDGTKESELYRLLLVAQCNGLNAAMPFLFERVDDETELLLPDNLLHSDSVIRKLVNEIDESDWQQVEIIGWLYQFYISEKKDEVIGKTVKSEDIPAATQLFTPNWIVKYMTQNSLGRLWLEANPTSTLASKMEYFIKSQNDERGTMNAEENSSLIVHSSSLSPEAITILDPACGSGHILVEAYDLLKEMYLERGYRLRDVPRLILQKNLFGLDIDERATQLASFALLMKARADDRRIFERMNAERGTRNQEEENSSFIVPSSSFPNILTIPDSSALPHSPRSLAESLFSEKARRGAVPILERNTLFGEMQAQPSLLMLEEASPASSIQHPASSLTEQHIIDLLECFALGKTLGSLIRIPAEVKAALPAIAELLAEKRARGNTYEQVAAALIAPFVQAAEMLARQYDCVIANPPYLGGKGMNPELKKFAANNFPNSKSDLFAMFIERNFDLAKSDGFNAMVTMQSWMFLAYYENLRRKILSEKNIIAMAHLGARAFSEISGEIVQTTVFVILNKNTGLIKPVFSRLVGLNESEKIRALQKKEKLFNNTPQEDYRKIPGCPIAYWVSKNVREIFDRGITLGEIAEPRAGLQTGENEKFLRQWTEVSFLMIGFGYGSVEKAKESGQKWFPYNKGGEFRKWFGNNEYIVNWKNDGEDIRADKLQKLEIGLCLPSNSKPKNQQYYFRQSLTWTATSSSNFGVRHSDKGFIFDIKGASCFATPDLHDFLLGFLASNQVNFFLSFLNPTIEFQSGNVASLPLLQEKIEELKLPVSNIVRKAVAIARADWDTFETSWDFHRMPMVDYGLRKEAQSVAEAFQQWETLCHERIQRMQELETENNRLFIDAYGLQDELSPEVPLEQITLARPDREADIKRLLSYAVGCMMGRYSLDAPGLVYADSGNVGFDATKYATFPADPDAIVPVMETDWFADDATNRLEEFVRKVWPAERLEENLRYIAASLGATRDEEARTTIRRYYATGFFKDHLKTYKKRPIYWLFSSGKQRAFQCLVYLHRYHEGTLARMRTEYVIPLQGKLADRIDALSKDIAAATSTSHRKKLEKEQDTLKKQQTELHIFQEKLRHAADQRIALDLDDGVKVNYGRFGDLLAEVKTVTGGSED